MSIAFEDLLRNSVFFGTEVKPYLLHNFIIDFIYTYIMWTCVLLTSPHLSCSPLLISHDGFTHLSSSLMLTSPHLSWWVYSPLLISHDGFTHLSSTCGNVNPIMGDAIYPHPLFFPLQLMPPPYTDILSLSPNLDIVHKECLNNKFQAYEATVAPSGFCCPKCNVGSIFKCLLTTIENVVSFQPPARKLLPDRIVERGLEMPLFGFTEATNNNKTNMLLTSHFFGLTLQAFADAPWYTRIVELLSEGHEETFQDVCGPTVSLSFFGVCISSPLTVSPSWYYYWDEVSYYYFRTLHLPLHIMKR